MHSCRAIPGLRQRISKGAKSRFDCLPLDILGDENKARPVVFIRPGRQRSRRMENVLYSVHDDRLVLTFDVENAFDTQNIAPHKRHQYIKPFSQRLFGNRFFYIKTECANMVVVAIEVMMMDIMPMLMIMPVVIMQFLRVVVIVVAFGVVVCVRRFYRVGLFVEPPRNIGRLSIGFK